ncbi:MAG: hypothetical protein JEZ04_22415 [Spirochaetales bacterium]|nr:hypothetical protein [Spirochaetales bacterium]
MRKLIFILIIAAVFSGCNMDYLEDALSSYEEDSPDLILTWNEGRTILTATDPLTEEVLWYETWEYDDNDDPVLVRRYSPEDRLKWSKLYKWNSGLKIEEVCYDSSNNLLWYSVFIYNSSGLIAAECNYDNANLIQWFDVYEYSGELNINRARYNSNSEMTSGFVWEFDTSDRKIKETHYAGNSSRNSAGLSYPDSGATPAFPSFSLTGLSVVDWTMWTYDSNGFFKMKFDNENYPLEVYREDSRLTRNLTVEIEYYSGHIPKSKLTRYGSDDVLFLELSYNSSGYLSEINTSGKGLLLPLRYTIEYKSDLSLNRISVYQGNTKLMYFTYDSVVNTDLTVHPLDPVGFTGSNYTITQYDGDDNRLGSYVFSMVDLVTLKIQALTADGTPNGHYLAHMDTEDEVASFECFSKDSVRQWHYNYNYAKIAGEIMRTGEEKYDDIAGAVEDYTSIDISTLTLDLLLN